MARYKFKHTTEIFRTTKCFGAWSHQKNGEHYNGAFPNGFMAWLKKMGWIGEKRCYLCAGMVDDAEAVRVDIRPECRPTHCEDARHTSLPSNEFDTVILDPPYSLELAKSLYGTEKFFAGIDGFTKEAARICKAGGVIITLTYQVPKRLHDAEFIAVCGIYTIPSTSYMRCLTVSRKLAKQEEKHEELQTVRQSPD